MSFNSVCNHTRAKQIRLPLRGRQILLPLYDYRLNWTPLGPITITNTYGLLIKCDVKMAGYWPSFFCVFMDRDKVEVHKLAKTERGQYPAILTEQAWSIEDLLHGFRGNFACGIQRVVPRG